MGERDYSAFTQSQLSCIWQLYTTSLAAVSTDNPRGMQQGSQLGVCLQ